MSDHDRYDVVVIGGGIVGAASAYYIAKTGMSVLLYERDDIAAAASGRNLGFVSLMAIVCDPTGAKLELIQRSRTIFETLADELGFDFGFRPTGGLHYFLDEQQRPLYEQLAGRLRDAAVDAEVVGVAELQAEAPGLDAGIPGALYLPTEAHDEPRRVVQGYVRAAERLGVVVERGVEVLELDVVGRRVSGVITTDGTVRSGRVVLAAGPWSAQLARRSGVDLPIMTMVSQVLSTEPMAFTTGPLLTGPGALFGNDFGSSDWAEFVAIPGYEAAAGVDDPRMSFPEWACQTADGRILLAGSHLDGTFQSKWHIAGLAATCDVFPRTLPALKNAFVERIWAGIIPYTSDGLPIVDRVDEPEGLVVAAGHSNGNATGPATGELVAALVAGSDVAPWAAECAYGRATLMQAAAQAL
jgi:glycine/D-amino acid oxidase-like deaminating enzyme